MKMPPSSFGMFETTLRRGEGHRSAVCAWAASTLCYVRRAFVSASMFRNLHGSKRSPGGGIARAQQEAQGALYAQLHSSLRLQPTTSAVLRRTV